jgi:hypothetical protein
MKDTQKTNIKTTANGFAKWQVQCFYDSLVQGSSSVFQLNICGKNRTLAKHENIVRQFCETLKILTQKFMKRPFLVGLVFLSNISFVALK